MLPATKDSSSVPPLGQLSLEPPLVGLPSFKLLLGVREQSVAPCPLWQQAKIFSCHSCSQNISYSSSSRGLPSSSWSGSLLLIFAHCLFYLESAPSFLSATLNSTNHLRLCLLKDFPGH